MTLSPVGFADARPGRTGEAASVVERIVESRR